MFSSPHPTPSQLGDNQLACHRCLCALSYGNLEIDIHRCCHLMRISQMFCLLSKVYLVCTYFQVTVPAFHYPRDLLLIQPYFSLIIQFNTFDKLEDTYIK